MTIYDAERIRDAAVVEAAAEFSGDSAYAVAVSQGFVGTVDDWLATLVGPPGADGADGSNGADGADGSNGADGPSAYDVAVANGFVGDEAAWLASLVGAPGADGSDGMNGVDGSDGADGAPGPNTVTAATTTNLTGILKGDGANVGTAAAGTDYVAPNAGITGATKTKLTYDAKGLVTSGADATTADIADSSNKRYVTDAQQTVIGNTSGTNTGDQDLSGRVAANGAITGATKTKVTYDAKGLVTAGADATTADIADSANKRYVTDAQQTVIGNTSGTNTGDQNLSTYAPLASPTLTGTPAAPTAVAGTNTTQLATTAFVQAAVTGRKTRMTFYFHAQNPGANATTAGQLIISTGTAAFSINAILQVIKVHTSGSIVGGGLYNNAAVTAQSIALKANINGATNATAIATLNTTNPRSFTGTVASGTITFTANQTIGADFVAVASYAPTTNDYVGWLEVEFDS